MTSAEKGHVPFDGRPAGSVVRIAAALGWSVQKIDQLLDEGALVTDESESRAAHETLDDIIADIRSSQELGRRDREIVISLIEQMRRERREGGE